MQEIPFGTLYIGLLNFEISFVTWACRDTGQMEENFLHKASHSRHALPRSSDAGVYGASLLDSECSLNLACC